MRRGFTLIELLIVIAIVTVLAVVVTLALNPAELLREARDSTRISDMALLKQAIQLYLTDTLAHTITPPMGAPWACYLSLTTTTVSIPICNWSDSLNSCVWGQWGIGTANGSTGHDSCEYAFDPAVGVVGVTSTNQAQAVNGSGWIPINFTVISGGSPISKEPVDPINQAGTCVGSSTVISLSSCGLFYSYESGSGNSYFVTCPECGSMITIPAGKKFALTAFMESKKYSTGGPNDVETNSMINPMSSSSDPYVYEVGTDGFDY